MQENLLLSHSVGLGDPIDDDVVWTMLFIKILSLCKGHSGVSIDLVNRLLDLLNSGYLPVVPSQGSVGASGDLAPLAHMALPLLGKGILSKKGEHVPINKVFSEKYQCGRYDLFAPVGIYKLSKKDNNP